MLKSASIRAFDRPLSARHYDDDGRLYVEQCNISKATVNPYRGSEIPNFEELGLNADKIYQLLRHPDELEKAAPSFRGLPLLSEHMAVDAANYAPDLVVGAVSNPVFEYPFLKADLVCWSAKAISGIESREKAQLSAGYRYRCVLEPGTFDGERYDARMT